MGQICIVCITDEEGGMHIAKLPAELLQGQAQIKRHKDSPKPCQRVNKRDVGLTVGS
jgi:hypothetical protein